MANVLVRESSLEAIADAIREKLNVQTTYKPSEMADAIESIGGGSTPVINPLSVTENGTYTAPSGVDGYSPVTVNVPQGVTPTGTKQISITENGTTIEDVTNYANAEITVNVSGGGSQQLTKLAEITLSEDSRSIAITPSSDWFNYDYLIVYYNLTLSASDYIYFSTTDTSGGSYTPSISSYNFVGSAYKHGSNIRFMLPYVNANPRIDISNGGSLYVYTYTATKSIVSGSNITIYGGYKSDL